MKWRPADVAAASATLAWLTDASTAELGRELVRLQREGRAATAAGSFAYAGTLAWRDRAIRRELAQRQARARSEAA